MIDLGNAPEYIRERCRITGDFGSPPPPCSIEFLTECPVHHLKEKDVVLYKDLLFRVAKIVQLTDRTDGTVKVLYQGFFDPRTPWSPKYSVFCEPGSIPAEQCIPKMINVDAPRNSYAYRVVFLNMRPSLLDVFIEKWHKGASTLPLHTYLGLSFPEYGKWVESSDHNALKETLKRRFKFFGDKGERP